MRRAAQSGRYDLTFRLGYRILISCGGPLKAVVMTDAISRYRFAKPLMRRAAQSGRYDEHFDRLGYLLPHAEGRSKRSL